MKKPLWVICGCESGPKARPMEPDWVRSLRDDCITAWSPFFLKQAMVNGRLVKMPELDGKVWN
jgi:protein gp37